MGDWKETLFVWRGDLYCSPAGEVTWKGSWVGTQNPIDEFPSPEDFRSSENLFELTCSVNKLTLSSLKLRTSRSDITWRGHYLLDNGGGPEKFEDFEHDCCFLPIDGALLPDNMNTASDKEHSCALYVVARGKTEFGEFVSRGVVLPSSKGTETDTGAEGDEGSARPLGLTLTLARRYVRSGDPRLKGALDSHATQELQLAVEEENQGHGTCRTAAGSRLLTPWTHLPLRVKKRAIKKPAEENKKIKGSSRKKSRS